MRSLPIVAFLVCLLTSFTVKGQSQDSVKAEKVRKNVVKLNLSSLVIYERAFLIGYERVIKKHQSFSVQAGPVSINYGLFAPADSLTFVSSTKNTGYSLTGDYRFYLPKENKDRPPHGVYIGPYVSYVHIYNYIILFNLLKTFRSELNKSIFLLPIKNPIGSIIY